MVPEEDEPEEKLNSLLQRLRGIIGTGISWASVWGVAGAGLHILARTFGWHGFAANSVLADIGAFATMGFFGGVVFSTGFLLTEGRRTAGELKPSRGAFWGALAGLTGPVLAVLYAAGAPMALIPDLWPLFVGTAVFGAGSGVAMTVLAKSDHQAALESSDADPSPPLDPGGEGSLPTRRIASGMSGKGLG